MTYSTDISGRMKGYDAMHRARNPETHPTHACSKQICGADETLIAPLRVPRFGNGAIMPFLAIADRISAGAPS